MRKKIPLTSCGIILVFFLLLVPFSNSALAASTVDSVNNQYATIYPTQRKAFYANGRYWVFYTDGTNMLLKTSTDGSTWGSSAIVRAATNGEHFSVWFDEPNGYFHYAYSSQSDNTPMYYRRGIPNSDGTVTWSAAEQTAKAQESGYSFVHPNIAVDSAGRALVGYRYRPTAGRGEVYVTKNANLDGTWSTDPGYPKQVSTTDRAASNIVIVPITNERYVCLHSSFGNPLVIKAWDGSAWKSQLSTIAVANTSANWSGVAEGDDVHIVFHDSGYIRYTKYTYSSNSISPTNPEQNIQTISSTNLSPVLTRDTTNNVLYCFWGNSTDNHIYYKRMISGIWDSNPTDWINEATDTLTSLDRLTSFYKDHDGKMGLLYMTKTVANYNVRFAERRVTSITPLIAYNENGGTDLLNSIYSSGSWGAATVAYDHNRALYWKVAKTSPNNSSQVVVWVEENSDYSLFASIWNGSSWNTTELGLLPSYSNSYRCFDAAYEQSSGQLLVVAADTVAGRIRYWVWDGNSWIINGTLYDPLYSTGNIHWIKMASKPNSDEISLILSDSVNIVEVLIWDGNNNTWLAEGSANRLSNGNLSSNTTEAIAVEYEQDGDQALFVYGYSDDIYWATYNGLVITSPIGKYTNIGGLIRWLRLKRDPSSDNIVLGFENDNIYNDIYALRWTGADWETSATQITTSSGYGNSDYNRPFDVIYESGSGHSGHIVFVYTEAGWALRYRHFNGTSWSSYADISAFYFSYWVQLIRQPDNLIHLAIHDDADDLNTWTWDNSSWTFKNEITASLFAGGANHNIEVFSLTGNSAGVFENRRQITILDSMTPASPTCTANLSNFPVLISLSNQTWLRTKANGGNIYNSNGYDIIFRAADGITQLDHEIEQYVGTNGTLVVWVRIPTLVYNGLTYIYMYYGNSGITSSTENPTGVWNEEGNNNYKAVWHLKEDPSGGTPQMKDSTSNTNHGSSGGSMTSGDQVLGNIDGSLDFDGTNDYINFGNKTSLDLTSKGTLSAWVKFAADPHQYSYLVGKSSGGNQTVQNYLMALANSPSDKRIRVKISDGSNYNQAYTATTTWTPGTWYYIVGEWDGTKLQMYVNGQPDGASVPQTLNAWVNSAFNVQVGCGFDTGCTSSTNAVNGVEDEVRISNIDRSACWIGTEYNNQSNPGMYISLGAEQGLGVPTAIKLTSFTATQYSEGVLLRWKTGHEVRNLGFHVYREENGQLTRLTPEPVAGSALLAGSRTAMTAGRQYQWWDASELSDRSSVISDQSSPLAPRDLRLANVRYWLEDVDLSGKRTLHGPVTPVLSREPIPEKFRPELLSEIGFRLQQRYRDYWKARELREKLALKRLEVRGAPRKGLRIGNKVPLRTRPAGLEVRGSQRRSDPSTIEKQRYLAGRSAVKLFVREEGWYRVTQSELVAAGLSPKANPRYLQLFVEGQEQPIRVIGETDERFDQRDAVEFYGVELDTPSTDTKVYWLIEGTKPGRRVYESKGYSGSLGSLSTSSFPYMVEKKDRTVYFAALLNGEDENFFGPVVYMNEVDQILELSNFDRAATEDALLEVVLQGATDTPHRVKVLLNEAEVGEIAFEGQGKGILNVRVSQSGLLEGENLVSLVAMGDDMDATLLDSIRLTYWHSYAADDNSLRFTAQGGEQRTIGGFRNSGIRVFDITEPTEVIEVFGRVESQKGGYGVSFRVPGDGERTLLALTEERAKSPTEVASNNPSLWHKEKGGYDLVIISHRDFVDSLQPLKQLRESQGLRVAVIDLEDIYDEFSFGNRSPRAIKDFLSSAKANWSRAPRFVLLVGDASFDPRNYLGLGDMDYVPTKLIDTVYMETASDDWFVDFNDDGLPEIAIGRLPVQTKEEAAIVVSKIVGYEKWGKKSEALFVADRSDNSDDYNFEGASEEVRTLLPAYLRVRQIYRSQFSSDDQAKAELLNGINEGALLMNFIGHGSIESWRGSLLTLEDAESLINGFKLPFFVNMTCLNGYFQNPYGETLAESLLKAGGGGAVAVWASSGLTEPDKQAIMNKELIKLLFGREPITLGEATARAKAAAGDQDVRKTWILFGDPTTRLRVGY